MTQAYVPPHDMPDPSQSGNTVRITALVIILLAALIATASYFAGRSARPGEDARARVEVPSPAVAEAAPAAEPEAAGAPFADFDLAQLHPQVAEAVARARDVQAGAISAALRGEAAARRARASASGTSVITYDGGDVYAGETVDGGRHGAGVYTWSNPQEDNYAGEFADDAMDGLGIKRWTDGATYYGDRRREAREGYGVFVDAEGGGYEGAWLNGAPEGYGVVWNADGTVSSQGRWAGNTLIEAWVVPTPVPTAEPGAPEASGPESGEAEVGGTDAGAAEAGGAGPSVAAAASGDVDAGVATPADGGG